MWLGKQIIQKNVVSFNFEELPKLSVRTKGAVSQFWQNFVITDPNSIHEVEHGSFTPIVFSSSGGMGKVATTTGL